MTNRTHVNRLDRIEQRTGRNVRIALTVNTANLSPVAVRELMANVEQNGGIAELAELQGGAADEIRSALGMFTTPTITLDMDPKQAAELYRQTLEAPHE